MSILSKPDELHVQARSNRWLRYFTIFVRVALAFAFFTSGMVKIIGDRFTVLTVVHPMGHFLDAIYRTGFYYTVVGIMQVSAAILLLIPRTATLGAVIYFPVILNICILSLSVRFEGSLLSSPLMVLANIYLLWWDYHKLKYILPTHHAIANNALPKRMISNKFPVRFFAGGFAIVALLMSLIVFGFNIQPRNHIKDCNSQCEDSDDPQACYNFCDCIHKQGQSLDSCLEVYEKALQKK